MIDPPNRITTFRIDRCQDTARWSMGSPAMAARGGPNQPPLLRRAAFNQDQGALSMPCSNVLWKASPIIYQNTIADPGRLNLVEMV